jgi:hypothetical protein
MDTSLALIQEQSPYRLVEFDMERVDVGKLTLLELLDACEAAEVDPEAMSETMDEGSSVPRARLLYGIAWVILRRVEPGLTYEETCTFDLVVTGEAKEVDANNVRAKATVAVAALAGVSTRQAEQMTMDEVAAVTELQSRRNRAARRRK